jgi:hypothetical protein
VPERLTTLRLAFLSRLVAVLRVDLLTRETFGRALGEWEGSFELEILLKGESEELWFEER